MGLNGGVNSNYYWLKRKRENVFGKTWLGMEAAMGYNVDHRQKLRYLIPRTSTIQTFQYLSITGGGMNQGQKIGELLDCYGILMTGGCV